MTKIRMHIMSFVAATLLIGSGAATNAAAQIRVDVDVTPDLRVRIANTTSSLHRSHRRCVPIHRKHREFVLTRQDRNIAYRLARYTGVPVQRLLHLKRRYSWAQIGRWLNLPRQVVRAAMHGVTWERFLRAKHRPGRHGPAPRKVRTTVDRNF